MLLYRSRGEFLRERSPGNGSFRWMFPRYSKEWAAVIRDERNTVYRRLPFFNANVSNSVDGPRGPAEVGAVRARWTNFKSISVFREFAPVFWKRRMNGELESLWKFVQKYIYIYIFRFAGFRGEVSYVDEKIGKICRIFLVIRNYYL